MRSEVQYAEGQHVTFLMPREPGDTFAPSAAEHVIGQKPLMTMPDGTEHATEVIAAVIVDGELRITVLIGAPTSPQEMI